MAAIPTVKVYKGGKFAIVNESDAGTWTANGWTLTPPAPPAPPAPAGDPDAQAKRGPGRPPKAKEDAPPQTPQA